MLSFLHNSKENPVRWVFYYTHFTEKKISTVSVTFKDIWVTQIAKVGFKFASDSEACSPS